MYRIVNTDVIYNLISLIFTSNLYEALIATDPLQYIVLYDTFLNYREIPNTYYLPLPKRSDFKLISVDIYNFDLFKSILNYRTNIMNIDFENTWIYALNVSKRTCKIYFETLEKFTSQINKLTINKMFVKKQKAKGFKIIISIPKI